MLLTAARRFLLGLLAMSEPLRHGPDDMEPELAPVEYDDAAFIEYMSESGHGSTNTTSSSPESPRKCPLPLTRWTSIIRQ